VLAHAAGAKVADLELCQFHPTALALPGSPLDGSLITEAVRGEGALLLDGSGQRFTDELAPRDVVSAAIGKQMEAEGADSVGLDLRGTDLSRFGGIVRTLAEAGLDPSAAPIPVAPAAHYTMGGIATDIDGRSSLGGLFAVGECACNGLHGANRLASNSLSECFVFGSRAVRAITASKGGSNAELERPAWQFEPPTVATRDAVWRFAGPSRDEAGLVNLLDDPYPLAVLTARCALARLESRGPHIRTDYPDLDPALDGMHVVIGADGKAALEDWR
jgi:L-aspartate oxidase